jgi:hypothetical protein
MVGRWSAGFLAGDVSLETGRWSDQGDFGEVGLAEECCRADCSPPRSASVLSQIFIGTMIGSWDAEGKDLRAVFFSNFRILKRESDLTASRREGEIAGRTCQARGSAKIPQKGSRSFAAFYVVAKAHDPPSIRKLIAAIRDIKICNGTPRVSIAL